jgi:hypothetical protein
MGPQRIHRVPMNLASPTISAEPRRLPPGIQFLANLKQKKGFFIPNNKNGRGVKTLTTGNTNILFLRLQIGTQ